VDDNSRFETLQDAVSVLAKSIDRIREDIRKLLDNGSVHGAQLDALQRDVDSAQESMCDLKKTVSDLRQDVGRIEGRTEVYPSSHGDHVVNKYEQRDGNIATGRGRITQNATYWLVIALVTLVVGFAVSAALITGGALRIESGDDSVEVEQRNVSPTEIDR